MNPLILTSHLNQVVKKHPGGAILIPGDAMEEYQHRRREQLASYDNYGEFRRFELKRLGIEDIPIKTIERIMRALDIPMAPEVAGATDYDTFVITSGSAAVATTLKVMAQMATGTALDNVMLGWDVYQNGALNATTAASQVDVQRQSGVSSGGATFTPNRLNPITPHAAATTVRINDTTNGATPTTLFSLFVPVVSGISYQYPLGRELAMTASSWLAFCITGATGVSANYIFNGYFAE